MLEISVDMEKRILKPEVVAHCYLIMFSVEFSGDSKESACQRSRLGSNHDLGRSHMPLSN